MSALPKKKANTADAVIAALRALPGRAERFDAMFPLLVEIAGMPVGRGARIYVRLSTRNHQQEPRLNAIPSYVLGTIAGVFVTQQPVATAGTIYDRSVTGDRKQIAKVGEMLRLFKTAERASCAFFGPSDLVGALLDSDQFCKPGDEPLSAAQVAAKRALVPQPLTQRKAGRKLKNGADEIIASDRTKLDNEKIAEFVNALPEEEGDLFKCWRSTRQSKVDQWAPVLLHSVQGTMPVVVNVIIGDTQHELPYIDFLNFYLECFGVKPMEIDPTLDEHVKQCALRWRRYKNTFTNKQRASKLAPNRLGLVAGKIVKVTSTSSLKRKRKSHKDSDDDDDEDRDAQGANGTDTALDAALDQVVDANPELESAARSFAVTLGASSSTAPETTSTTATPAKPKRKRVRKPKQPTLDVASVGADADAGRSPSSAASALVTLSGKDALNDIAEYMASEFAFNAEPSTTPTLIGGGGAAAPPVFVVVNVPEQHRALLTRAVMDPLAAPVFISMLLNKQSVLSTYVREGFVDAAKSVLEIPHSCIPATSARAIARGNAAVLAAFSTGVRDEFRAMLERGGYARVRNTVDADTCPVDPRSPNVCMTSTQVLVGIGFERDVMVRGAKALVDIDKDQLVGYYHGAIVKDGAHAIDGAAALSMCAGESEAQATDEYVVGDVDLCDEATGKITKVCVTASPPEYHQCVLAQAVHTTDWHANARIMPKWDHVNQGLHVLANRPIKAGQRVVFHYGAKYHQDMLDAGIKVGTPVIDPLPVPPPPISTTTTTMTTNSTFADSVLASKLQMLNDAEMASFGLVANTNALDDAHADLRALTTSAEPREAATPPPTTSTLFGAQESPLVQQGVGGACVDDDNDNDNKLFEFDDFDHSQPVSRWTANDDHDYWKSEE